MIRKLNAIFKYLIQFFSFLLFLTDPNNYYNNYNSIASIRLDTDNRINIKLGEVIVVCAVLCTWLFIIFNFIKKWSPLRSLEPNAHRSNIRTGKSIVETDSLNGTSAPTKSRLQSFANVTTIPKLHMSESHNSLCSEHQSLLANSCKHHLSVLSQRPRLNSVFLASQSRRNSYMPDDSNSLTRRYKSAEDLQSLGRNIDNYL